MKKLVLLLACVICATLTFGEGGAKLVFDRTEHNFGDIPHKAKEIACTFDFTNGGNAPLVITKIVTSCTCTKADYPKKPVMPGQKGTVRITYEPSKKDAGMFYKAVEVYSNSADAKRKTIIIRGKAIE